VNESVFATIGVLGGNVPIVVVAAESEDRRDVSMADGGTPATVVFLLASVIDTVRAMNVETVAVSSEFRFSGC
jgi:hypothetical protein